MRAPGVAPGQFVLETAMDELAGKLGLDPIDLRLRNYADSDPESGKEWSSKSLRECYAQGAAQLRLASPDAAQHRARRRRAHRLRHGDRGLSNQSFPATARLTLRADGSVAGRDGNARDRPGRNHFSVAGRRRCAGPAARSHRHRHRRHDTALRCVLSRIVHIAFRRLSLVGGGA